MAAPTPRVILNNRRVTITGADSEHDRDQHHASASDTDANADANADHPEEQFTTLALPLVVNPASSRARRLNLCFHCGHTPPSGTTIHVAADRVYRTPYPYPVVPAPPWRNVTVNKSIQLYCHYHGDSRDNDDDLCTCEDVDLDVHVGVNIEPEPAFDDTSPTKGLARDAPTPDSTARDTPSLDNHPSLERNSSLDDHPSLRDAPLLPSWLPRLTLVVGFLLSIIASVPYVVPRERVILPIHIPVVGLLQSFDPLVLYPPPISWSNQHATRHYEALAEYRSAVDGLCAVAQAMFRDNWGISDWYRGPPDLDPVAMRELARACGDVQKDLEGARLALGEATSRVPTEISMLLIMALEMNQTTARWASGVPGHAETMAMPGPAALRDWLRWLAPELDVARTRESSDAQSRILHGITGVHTQLSSFIALVRRATWTVDVEVVPILSATSNAYLASDSLTALGLKGRERTALVQAARDIAAHVCRLQNALQALEDMVMALLIIATAAGEDASGLAAGRHRFWNTSVLDDWDRPTRHLPGALLSAVYSSLGRTCPHDGRMSEETRTEPDTGISLWAASAPDPSRRKVSGIGRGPSTWDTFRDHIRPQEFSIPRPDTISSAISAAINALTADRQAILDARERRSAAMRKEKEANLERDRLITSGIITVLDSGAVAKDVAAAGGWRALLQSVFGTTTDEVEMGKRTGTPEAAKRFLTEYGEIWAALPADTRLQAQEAIHDPVTLEVFLQGQRQLQREGRIVDSW